MKYINILIIALLVSLCSYSHPPATNLQSLITYSKYIVSGTISSLEEYSYTLDIDSVYYGNYKKDEILIIDDSYEKHWCNRIEKGYMVGDKKLVFVSVKKSCEGDTSFVPTGTYMEGELSIKGKNIIYNEGNSKENFISFMESILFYKNTINSDKEYFLNDSINAIFKANKLLNGFLENDLQYYNKKQEEYKKSYKTEPQPAISVLKMNVVYLGFKNPIQVAHHGYHPNDLILKASQGKLIQYENGFYDVIPNKVGKLTLYVCVNDTNSKIDTIASNEFRVKDIPKPVAKVAGKTEGEIHKLKLAASGAIHVSCDFDFDIRFKVTSYIVEDSLSNKSFKGCFNKFPEELVSYIKTLESGTKLIFKDIVATPGNGIEYEIDPIEIIIK